MPRDIYAVTQGGQVPYSFRVPSCPFCGSHMSRSEGIRTDGEREYRKRACRSCGKSYEVALYREGKQARP